MAAICEILLFVSVLVCLTTAANSDNWSNVQYPTMHDGETANFYYTAFINTTFVDPVTGRIQTERSEIGKFGEEHIGFASGVLVHIKSGGDNTGCTMPFRSTKYPGDLPKEPWIALIKRGDCHFQVKVDNAYRSNASGVIIYNNEDKNGLEKMLLKSPERGVRVAVFTFKWKGEELARLLDNGTQILTNISIGNNCRVSYNINSFRPWDLNQPHRRGAFVTVICGTNMPIYECALLTSVLFVSISFIVLMVISLAWLVFYYVQRFRYIHAKDRLSRRLCSAAKKALSKIPTKHIKCDDKEMQGDGECCAICIEPYKTSDVVRILPCRHEFHRSCIDPWLLEHRTCPMCKMDILKHYGFVFTGSQESILHMDIEEAVSDSESLHHRSLSPVPQIRSSDLQASSSGNPQDVSSHSSRPSTPNELTPSLSLPGPSSDTIIRIPPEVQGQMVVSTSEFLSAKTNPQLRRSVSLDNCELTSNSQSKQ